MKRPLQMALVAIPIFLPRLLGSISVDLIVLATPSGLHSSQAIAAAEIGVHVCTEKPMATNLDDGIAI